MLLSKACSVSVGGTKRCLSPKNLFNFPAASVRSDSSLLLSSIMVRNASISSCSERICDWLEAKTDGLSHNNVNPASEPAINSLRETPCPIGEETVSAARRPSRLKSRMADSTKERICGISTLFVPSHPSASLR